MGTKWEFDSLIKRGEDIFACFRQGIFGISVDNEAG